MPRAGKPGGVKGLIMSIRKAIELSRWGFPNLDADVFTKARFSESNGHYLRFRVVIFTYWLFWLAMVGSQSAKGTHFSKEIGENIGDEWLFFIYLTDLTALLEGVVYTLALLAAVWPDSRPLCRTYWVLRTALVPSALIVTLLYWPLDFDGVTSLTDCHAHAVNSVLVLLDMVVSRLPYHIKHWYCSGTYLLLYVFFNAIWCLNGGRDGEGRPYIYPVLTWQVDTAEQRSDLSLLLCFVIFVVFPVVHVGVFLLDLLLQSTLGPSPSSMSLISHLTPTTSSSSIIMAEEKGHSHELREPLKPPSPLDGTREGGRRMLQS